MQFARPLSAVLVVGGLGLRGFEAMLGAGHASEAEPLQPDDPFHVGEG